MYKVYLVDDEEILLREMLSIIDWEAYGYKICGYNTDPILAEKEIISNLPDLIFTDVKMDELNGLQLVEQVSPKLPDCTFVFLSAYDSFEYAVKAMQIGAIDYLTKPISSDKLIELIVKIKKSKDKKYIGKLNLSKEGKIAVEDANAVITLIKEDIEKNYQKDLSLQDYAKKYNFNSSYLSQTFKKYMGLSFKDYVIKYKIKVAKYLLQNTNKKIKEIAYEVGYDDYFHFSKIFKKYTGITPIDCRNNKLT